MGVSCGGEEIHLVGKDVANNSLDSRDGIRLENPFLPTGQLGLYGPQEPPYEVQAACFNQSPRQLRDLRGVRAVQVPQLILHHLLGVPLFRPVQRLFKLGDRGPRPGSWASLGEQRQQSLQQAAQSRGVRAPGPLQCHRSLEAVGGVLLLPLQEEAAAPEQVEVGEAGARLLLQGLGDAHEGAVHRPLVHQQPLLQRIHARVVQHLQEGTQRD